MEEIIDPNAILDDEELIPQETPAAAPQIEYVCDEERIKAFQDEISSTRHELSEVREELKALSDLFSRRLMNDKKKNELIQTVTDAANYACIEPFLYDLILLLDRIEGEKDEVVQSIKEELTEILERRGVEKIKVTREFNSKLNKAVRVTESEEVTSLQVVRIVRNGYTYADRVVRPAEVVVARPKKPVPPTEA